MGAIWHHFGSFHFQPGITPARRRTLKALF
jgi:hypothetical protein